MTPDVIPVFASSLLWPILPPSVPSSDAVKLSSVLLAPALRLRGRGWAGNSAGQEVSTQRDRNQHRVVHGRNHLLVLLRYFVGRLQPGPPCFRLPIWPPLPSVDFSERTGTVEGLSRNVDTSTLTPINEDVSRSCHWSAKRAIGRTQHR